VRRLTGVQRHYPEAVLMNVVPGATSGTASESAGSREFEELFLNTTRGW